MIRTLVSAAALFVLLSCSADVVTAARWQQMPREDRVLYVKTLIGEEMSKDAKGGRGKRVTRTAEEYVAAIDAAYARGDQRNAKEIFSELPH